MTNTRQKTDEIPEKYLSLYNEGKCRECSVIVTQMDFEKILGKFTKVKVVFENGDLKSTTDKDKIEYETSPTNSRLSSNENGMVLIHRSAYKSHPAREKMQTRRTAGKIGTVEVLKENNRNKVAVKPSSDTVVKKKPKPLKKYKLRFSKSMYVRKERRPKFDVKFDELIPKLDKSVLPSDDWIVDYAPKDSELKKVYDRVEAELESLMTDNKDTETKREDEKNDDMPSILDMLNDNSTQNKNYTSQTFTELPSLEDMDINKSKDENKTDITKDIEVKSESCLDSEKDNIESKENANSESELKKEETKPESMDVDQMQEESKSDPISDEKKTLTEETNDDNFIGLLRLENVELATLNELTFSNLKEEKKYKVVKFFKTFEYNVEIDGKKVEFCGAPKYVSSPEDLQVLLEIVNEATLENSYLLH